MGSFFFFPCHLRVAKQLWCNVIGQRHLCNVFQWHLGLVDWQFLSSFWHIQVWMSDGARSHLNKHPCLELVEHERTRKTRYMLYNNLHSIGEDEQHLKCLTDPMWEQWQHTSAVDSQSLRSVRWFLWDWGRPGSFAHTSPCPALPRGMGHQSRTTPWRPLMSRMWHINWNKKMWQKTSGEERGGKWNNDSGNP